MLTHKHVCILEAGKCEQRWLWNESWECGRDRSRERGRGRGNSLRNGEGEEGKAARTPDGSEMK